MSGKTDKENLTPDDVIKFPCSVIAVIDKLWTKYSNGCFGFSVQQKIYTNLGGTDDISQIYLKVLNATGEKLGLRLNDKWIPYEKLNFSLEAPTGSLPVAWWESPYGAKLAVYFLARLKACNI
ncbi:MAG: GUN4 domain-containing protein [Microcoleaceae cyanobacterium]